MSDYSFKLDWAISKNTFSQIASYDYLEDFASPPYRIGNVKVLIRWYPKGSNEKFKNKRVMAIGIDMNSSRTKKMQVKWEIYCPEYGFLGDYENEFAQNANPVFNWGFLRSEVVNIDHISFQLSGKIIAIYDENDEHVDKSRWNEYLGIDDNDENKQSENNTVSSLVDVQISSLSDIITKLQNEMSALKKENVELKAYVFEEKRNDEQNVQPVVNVTSELLALRLKCELLQQQIHNMGNKENQNDKKQCNSQDDGNFFFCYQHTFLLFFHSSNH
eukprot:383492_1